MGNPLDSTVMMGAQASEDQYNKILSYFDIGKQEGAKCYAVVKHFIRTAGWSMVIISSQPFSKAITRCAFSRKKFLGL
jgi:aldehyde dehydrogenase